MEVRVPSLLEKTPTTMDPANIDAEYEVLGAILIDPGVISRIVGKLPTEAFYVNNHRVIYEACLTLHRNDQVIDLISLSTALAAGKQLDRVGGKRAISSLFDACVTSANVEQHAELIVEKYQRRCMARLGAAVQKMANDTSKSVGVCLGEAESGFRELLSLSTTGSNVLRLGEVLEVNLTQAEQASQGEGVQGIPTDFYDLDAMTRGILPGKLTVLAGRPSMGKTAMLINTAVQVAKRGHGVYLASLEMSAPELGFRCLASDGGLNANQIREGKLEVSQWEKVGDSLSRLSGLPIWIDDTFNQTPESISANIQRINAENPAEQIKLVMVDYLQLMGQRGSANRVSELGNFTRSFKGAAKELGVNIWALSQLSRGVESRTNKRPMNSDLRESGNIEEDADLILFLYREEYYQPDTPDRGIAEVIIGKNRSGPTGTVKLLFEPQFTRFRNMAA